MLTAEDLREEHYRNDTTLPQKWDAVRPVMISGWNGEPMIVEYHKGLTCCAVACIHAYLVNIDKIYNERGN